MTWFSLQKTSLDWSLAAQFAGPAILGMFGGFAVADKVPGGNWKKPLLASSLSSVWSRGAPQPGSRYPAAEAEVSGAKSLWQRSAIAVQNSWTVTISIDFM